MLRVLRSGQPEEVVIEPGQHDGFSAVWSASTSTCDP